METRDVVARTGYYTPENSKIPRDAEIMTVYIYTPVSLPATVARILCSTEGTARFLIFTAPENPAVL